MKISKIYEGLQNQAGTLAGMEQQIKDLLDTNMKNLQDVDCLELTTNRGVYFDNQYRCFNVLFEAVVDLKVVNSYILLEIESQLRQENNSENKLKENENESEAVA